MTQPNFSTAAGALIASYGQTARHLIAAYRAGGTRLATLMDRRWDAAMARSADQLTAEVRENAEAAHALFNDYYARGIALSSGGADAVVDKVVELAGRGLQQAAVNADRFEEKTGVDTLARLARGAVPALVAARKVATRIERHSGQWAARVAGRRTGASRRARHAA